MSKTHFVRKLAMFDQFPYTEHIESGAILQKNNYKLLQLCF
ncbi:MAG: hypothetical protein CM15mP86_06650 [Gammaproteobacteria bacterium]|nr:MAG: hypothetical protein CM15mP86_06650 [Gammaproteobacteria bacterium]